MTYEKAGVSAGFWFTGLESSTYSEVFGSKGLTSGELPRFACDRGFLGLDFVKLTGRAMGIEIREERREGA